MAKIIATSLASPIRCSLPHAKLSFRLTNPKTIHTKRRFLSPDSAASSMNLHYAPIRADGSFSKHVNTKSFLSSSNCVPSIASCGSTIPANSPIPKFKSPSIKPPKMAKKSAHLSRLLPCPSQPISPHQTTSYSCDNNSILPSSKSKKPATTSSNSIQKTTAKLASLPSSTSG